MLEHGKALFGAARDKGIRLDATTLRLEVVRLGERVGEDDLLVWDEKRPTRPWRSSSRSSSLPDFRRRWASSAPSSAQATRAACWRRSKTQQDRQGAGTLEALLYSGEVWQVAEDGAITRGRGRVVAEDEDPFRARGSRRWSASPSPSVTSGRPTGWGGSGAVAVNTLRPHSRRAEPFSLLFRGARSPILRRASMTSRTPTSAR